MTDASAPSRPFAHPADLHVIAVFFNFNRFKAPVANFRRFAAHMAELGVTLHIVELVTGKTPFQVTEGDNPHHVRLTTRTEFFQKENLINIGVRNALRLYPGAEYFAWVDADIRFFNPDVVSDTIHALERKPVAQMWSFAIDLDPHGHPLHFRGQNADAARSFGWCYANQASFEKGYGGAVWHCGYAWAARRDTLEAMGGLYEHDIVGATDYHMAWSFVGKPTHGIHGQCTPAFKADALAWCRRACDVVQGNLGVVDGLIHHHWHGRKADRRYVERWKILVDNEYDPALDLTRDLLGQLHLTGRKPKLLRDIAEYMRARNEDANTVA
jgi:hypothetical protein